MSRRRRLLGCSLFVLAFLASALCCIGGRSPAELHAADGKTGGWSWSLGNCNMDGSLDISDAIAALKFLFTRRDRQICAVLCDVDEDGELSISDPIAILNYLFQGEPFRAPLPVAEELCDGIDNDCNGLMDEDCPTGGGVSVQLAWDPVTKDVKGLPEDVAGYQVHFGRSSGDYPHLRDAGNATRYELTGLVPEVRYYFAVKTYDRSRNVSDFSNEVSVLAGR